MECYTIGYSGYTVKQFLEMLKHFQINYVLDVRSVPYSKFAPQFNRELIQKSLASGKIHYAFMGKYLGARPEDRSLYSDGYLDFEKMKESDLFKTGLQSVIRGIEKGNHIALMCAEKDPLNCHRAVLVGKALADSEVNVLHILQDGTIKTQSDLDNEMLDLYFPERRQPNLFETKSQEEYLKEAYRKRNAEIGYQIA